VQSHYCEVECIDADEVLAYFLYLISIMQRNLFEIRSCAILGGFTLWIRVLVISRSMNVLPFDWLTKRHENCLLGGSCCLRNKR